ncbi:MAG: TlpA family protein disulfide reductase [Anaerolineae bacterium]|jgi:cytochrome c biogenesis protein CcmG, thiol:disulfide interchange protein DsbE|nr:TlpA family protein disulfide reductase [Anaerolineae bacterium]MBT7188761.1 TlpA family protein disulfide reductase [Anaerolineae bacterium]MBT7600576.1 TlpA family protein disulfide reductase [Anaerolineae bacterium]MBT7988742.1 TlpA family protein disulfide reductase [Anaerolineae bacterium]
MQPTQRRLLFIGIVALGLAWTLFSADKKGNSTAGLIPAPQAGFLAPDFTLETLEGESITLSDLRGKAVLLNFWATWCPPCRAEMPAFQQAYADYADQDFVIVAVNAIQQDNLAAINEFQAEFGLSFPIVLDNDANVSRAYQVRSLPTSFFIDKKGVISEVVIGGPIAEALIRSRIEELIK